MLYPEGLKRNDVLAISTKENDPFYYLIKATTLLCSCFKFFFDFFGKPPIHHSVVSNQSVLASRYSVTSRPRMFRLPQSKYSDISEEDKYTAKGDELWRMHCSELRQKLGLPSAEYIAGFVKGQSCPYPKDFKMDSSMSPDIPRSINLVGLRSLEYFVKLHQDLSPFDLGSLYPYVVNAFEDVMEKAVQKWKSSGVVDESVQRFDIVIYLSKCICSKSDVDSPFRASLMLKIVEMISDRIESLKDLHLKNLDARMNQAAAVASDRKKRSELKRHEFFWDKTTLCADKVFSTLKSSVERISIVEDRLDSQQFDSDLKSKDDEFFWTGESSFRLKNAVERIAILESHIASLSSAIHTIGIPAIVPAGKLESRLDSSLAPTVVTIPPASSANPAEKSFVVVPSPEASSSTVASSSTSSSNKNIDSVFCIVRNTNANLPCTKHYPDFGRCMSPSQESICADYEIVRDAYIKGIQFILDTASGMTPAGESLTSALRKLLNGHYLRLHDNLFYFGSIKRVREYLHPSVHKSLCAETLAVIKSGVDRLSSLGLSFAVLPNVVDVK